MSKTSNFSLFCLCAVFFYSTNASFAMSNSVGVMNKTSQKVGLQCVREGHFNNVHMEGRLKAATNSYLTRCPTQAILVFI